MRLERAVLLLAFAAPAAMGQELPLDAPVETNALDRGHAQVSGYVLRLVSGIDHFLHDALADEDHESSRLIEQFYGDRYMQSAAAAGSYVRITPEISFSDDPAVETDIDFNARLRLRRFSDRLEVFVSRSEEDEDVLGGVLGRVSRRLRERDEDGGAGLRYRLPEYFALRSSVSASLALKPEPVLRLKVRGRLQADLGAWRTRLSETLFWESDDGFGEKTQLEFIRPIGSSTVFRTSTAAVWSETSEGIDLGQSAAWSHEFSRRRSLALRAGVAGHTEPDAIVDLYTARVTWRQRVYRDWFFVEVEPGVDFPNDEDFDAVPLLSIRFDIVLGAVKPDA